MSVNAKNPILPGFYPDPSICAVGEDYYLVNSSFAYFPGLPIMHSKDLVHWEQIGNALDRESQLPLAKAEISQGLFAPTLRYHDGVYYMICTNVTNGGNFIVTATDPAGPWSERHLLPKADGIDPSLFFDEDGKCYYCGTHPNPEGCKYDGDWYIYVQELDIETFELVGEPKNVWNGAMKGVHWPEGPHIYHIGEYYYIIHAEGGTGPEHAVSVARSKNVFGPYENNFCNPIFTHRHLGVKYPIKYVGHADLFQTVKGDWYMVMLAVRPTGGYTTMGRETFLARVIWENGWPVVNPGMGILSNEVIIDLDEWTPSEGASLATSDRIYDFTKLESFGPEWLWLRNPDMSCYSLEPSKGLFMDCKNIPIMSRDNTSFVGIRQDSHVFETTTVINTDGLFEGAKAGLIYMQNSEYYLKAEVEGLKVNVLLSKGEKEELVGSVNVAEETATLLLRVAGTKASVFAGTGNKVNSIVKDIDISCLSTEVAGGFVGCTVGLYACDSEDRENPIKANFKSFGYRRVVS